MAIGIGVQLIHFGLFQQAYGVYLPVLVEEMDWTAAALGGVYAMHQVTAGVLGPVQGWALTRFGIRAVAIAGTLVLAIALVGLGTARTFTAFAAWFVVGAIGQYLAGFLTLVSSVVSWFGRSSALALGLMQTGIGLAGFVAPAIAWGIESHGWREVLLASSGIVIVVGLPLALRLKSGPHAAKRPQPGDPSGQGAFRQAVRSGSFWTLGAGHALALALVQGVNVYVVLHLTDRGVTLPLAASVVAITTSAMVVGQLGSGLLALRWPTRWLAAGCMLAHGAALLLLLVDTVAATIIPFALLHGAAWGVRGPLMQSMRAEYFGTEAFPRIMGMSLLIATVGAGAGPLGVGMAAELFGGFREVFLILVVTAVVGAMCFALSRRPRGKLVR